MGVEDKAPDSHFVSEAVVEKRLDYDSESLGHQEPGLKRQLKNRHIAMIRCVRRARARCSCDQKLT